MDRRLPYAVRPGPCRLRDTEAHAETLRRLLCASDAGERDRVTRTTFVLTDASASEKRSPGATELGSCLTDATRGCRRRRTVRACRYAANRTDSAAIIAAL